MTVTDSKAIEQSEGYRAHYLVGAHLDHCGTLLQPPVRGASNPGTFRSEVGGIGFNMAAASQQLGLPSTLISPIGDDPQGEMVRSALSSLGIGDGTFIRSGHVTANYTSIVQPDGDLVIALADMDIYETTAFGDLSGLENLNSRDHVVINTNLRPEILRKLVRHFRERADGKPNIVGATVSQAKAPRLRSIIGGLDCLFTNRKEAMALLDLNEPAPKPETLVREFQALGCDRGIITDGHRPLFWWHGEDTGSIAPPLRTPLVNVIGAGDALCGTVLAALNTGKPFPEAVRYGLAAASLTVEQAQPVYHGLSWSRLRTRIKEL